ncbi:MAG: hypothetical protein OEU92_29995 [Alphaproteobacteria bacterium]|nr:hypothetical protein [Alphaproteobacteria bacterium]
MGELDLGPIEERLAISTEGPWTLSGHQLFVQVSQQEFDPLLSWHMEGNRTVAEFIAEDDAELCAHAWQDMTDMVAEIRRLREHVARLQLKNVDRFMGEQRVRDCFGKGGRGVMSVRDEARKALAEAVLADLTDRRGIRQEYDQFDDDIKQEITEAIGRIGGDAFEATCLQRCWKMTPQIPTGNMKGWGDQAINEAASTIEVWADMWGAAPSPGDDE